MLPYPGSNPQSTALEASTPTLIPPMPLPCKRVSNFSASSWREQFTDPGDDVRFVLDQEA